MSDDDRSLLDDGTFLEQLEQLDPQTPSRRPPTRRSIEPAAPGNEHTEPSAPREQRRAGAYAHLSPIGGAAPVPPVLAAPPPAAERSLIPVVTMGFLTGAAVAALVFHERLTAILGWWRTLG
jgi:hypothetical protein